MTNPAPPPGPASEDDIPQVHGAQDQGHRDQAAQGPGPQDQGPPGTSQQDRVLTVPNALTALRLACLPVFGLLLARPEGRGRTAAAFLLYGLGVTDGLDGYIARHFNQASSLGAAADPLVDRALVLSATGGALAIGAVPPWLAGIVLAREAVVAGGAVALATKRAGRLDVSWAGKAGAAAMMGALPLFILSKSRFRWHSQARVLAWVFAAGGQFFAWVAAAGYIPKAWAAISEQRNARSAS